MTKIVEVAVPDVKIAIGSLPLFLRPSLSNFPQNAYLVPDSQKTDVCRDRLAALGMGLKVGVSWRGGSKPSVSNPARLGRH